VGIVLGVALGVFRPAWAVRAQPLGNGFILLIRMLVAPIVFVTVVSGIARMRDLRRVGRVGLKALIYFEVVTTFSLFLGLVVGKVLRPGAGVHADAQALGTSAIAAYLSPATSSAGVGSAFHDLIPETLFSAFTSGRILQLLAISILIGVALAALGERTEKLLELIEQLGEVVFYLMRLVLWLAPVGAFGAMAFTVGKFGLSALANLGLLILAFYVTAVLFVVVVLGLIGRWVGVSIFRLLLYLRDELLLVLGTSSSESALAPLMDKMEALGCARPVVDLVVPTGYAFNLDGTSIYLTLATLFMAQALQIHLSIGDELLLLAVLLLTSKGAATVTGGGFITLAATLGSTGLIPVAGLTLLLGVDRFMSEARALTNLVGNAMATLAISKWEGELDLEKGSVRPDRSEAEWKGQHTS
jgi:aerobic C4-dicarboxylate transport protein